MTWSSTIMLEKDALLIPLMHEQRFVSLRSKEI